MLAQCRARSVLVRTVIAASPLHIAGHVVKNVLAPFGGSARRRRGCLGLDGDTGEVLRALGDLAPAIAAIGRPLTGTAVLELGPGRSPELGAAMLLAGAEHVTAFDIDIQIPEDAMSPDRYVRLAAALAGDDPRATAFRLAAGVRPDQIRARASQLSAGEWPASFKLYNGSRLPAPDASFGFAWSNAVLEHVRVDAVDSLLHELRRVLRPGAGMAHVVDLRDHTHVDGSDGVHGDWLEALRYPDWLFEAMFSRRSTQINRLRSPEWYGRIEAAGFEIAEWDERRFPLAATFASRRLQPRWRALDAATLAVGGIRFAARTPA